MTPIDLKREVESDIKRYSSILEMYRSGKVKTGEVEGQAHLIEQTSEIARHLENVIRELRALLRDG
jgi:hypothetical protein